MKSKIAGMVMLSVFCLCGHTFALQILYPLDGTYVAKSNYLIVMGGTDPMLDGVTIEINGVSSEMIDLTGQAYRAAYGDKLIVEPIFDPGENRIIVKGFLNNEIFDQAKASVYYLNGNDLPPQGYEPERFHLLDREKPCARCHNMAPTAEELNSTDPSANPCAPCHARMLNKTYVHGPAAIFECAYCHQPDSVPYKYRPRSGDANLCFECHEDMQETVPQSKFIHGPVEAGMCLVCHDAHASDQPMQMQMPFNRLCLGCHEKVANESHVVQTSAGGHPLGGTTDPSRPERSLSCVSCHAPHAAETNSFLGFGAKSRMALCLECHKK